MEQSYWRKCGTCKKEIGWGQFINNVVFLLVVNMLTAQLIAGLFMTL